jgi:hypothetical protein
MPFKWLSSHEAFDGGPNDQVKQPITQERSSPGRDRRKLRVGNSVFKRG